MFTIYSLECFLYKFPNEVLRVGDLSKTDTLGSNAYAMNEIVCVAISAKDQELDASLF
jgi:predicted HAD superfamily phosphohydrolase YqeG